MSFEEQEQVGKYLDQTQKKLYRQQYWNIMIPTAIIIIVSLTAIIQSVIQVFQKSNTLNGTTAIYLIIAVLTTQYMMQTIQITKDEIRAIENRIRIRTKKNRKQHNQNYTPIENNTEE